ncbi:MULTISPECIES: HAD family hydrolase [unclassified Aureimonas]|uniref:HAD family hydrolase n=1 Tax=unclassified Aureimonas TaxID=2615206 RepID=UPI0009E7DE9D|nr:MULTISPECIES: HAD family hydrolase [unclassified Aureimonas]
MTTLAGVLFDKDGTLLDFDATWGPATREVLGTLSGGDERLFRALAETGGYVPDTGSFRPDSPIIGGDTTEFAPAWALILGSRPDEAFADRVNRLYRAASLTHLTAYDDVAPIIDGLCDAGLAIGLATNDSEVTARAHLEALGLLDRFSYVAGYDSGWGGKPAPGMVAGFAAHANAPTEAIVMIGDSPHDIAAARAAGAFAIGIARTPRAAANLGDLPDVTIRSLTELPAVLGRHFALPSRPIA